MRFAFIDVEKASYPMRVLCRVLEVSRSGYYAWRFRKPSSRNLEDERLRPKIVEAFKTGRGTYGSPRVRSELVAQGFEIGRKRVARLMRELGLQGVCPRKFRVTTQSDHDHPIAENVLDREFEATGPNEKWATDITYVYTGEGWLYLAVVMDLFSRRIVGWPTADHLKTELCLDALQMALDHRVGVEGLLHHSDRGVQLGFKRSSQHLRIEELRWRRASVDDQIMRYVHRCVHLAVLGSRVKLLGRKIERGEIRHYAGRIFATCASVTLGIAFYDTQCGSKLFRNDPEARRCFQEPFLGRWTFDVEILARMIAGRRRAGDGSIDELVYEYPLRIWREFGESKVRPWDLLTGLWDLTRIRRHYFGRAEARRSIVGEPSPRPVGSGRPTQGRDSQR